MANEVPNEEIRIEQPDPQDTERVTKSIEEIKNEIGIVSQFISNNPKTLYAGEMVVLGDKLLSVLEELKDARRYLETGQE